MPPRRTLRTVPTVVLPGWNGSGEGHWQTWLEQQLVDAGRVAIRPPFADYDHPTLTDWSDTLRDSLAPLPSDGFDVVAHSLGAVLWLHHATDPGDSPRPARVALVGPPAPDTDVPELGEFFPPPIDVDAVRRAADGTVLVAGSDDPYLPLGIAESYGRPLKIATTVVEGAGHINVATGFGPWPAMLDWCNRENLAFY